MSEFSKWDGLDTASGFVMGIVAGMASLFGWFSGKVGKVHARIDDVQQHMNFNTASIRVLEAQRTDHLQRLDRMDDHLAAINEKQDRQMAILVDLKSRH